MWNKYASVEEVALRRRRSSLGRLFHMKQSSSFTRQAPATVVPRGTTLNLVPTNGRQLWLWREKAQKGAGSLFHVERRTKICVIQTKNNFDRLISRFSIKLNTRHSKVYGGQIIRRDNCNNMHCFHAVTTIRLTGSGADQFS
jgi:hypothetical protein